MPLFRRRKRGNGKLPPRLEAFDRFAARIDLAQRSLLSAIPTPRDPGLPLALALAEFGRHLDDAAELLAEWRSPENEAEWQRCAEAVAAARAEGERLRLEPARLDFERLNTRIGDVLHPLEDVVEVERSLRRGTRR